MIYRSIPYIFSCLVVAAALLMTAWTGSPWGLSVLGMLFIFVVFPRWRGKAYRLAYRLTRKHDCSKD
jgi:hypothetical protein